MTLQENVRQAFLSIKSNGLRAGLTMLIIAFGVMAIVGVLTSIDGIKFWLTRSFSTLGANTFKIENRETNLRIGGNRTPRKGTVNPVITWLQAKTFKERFAEFATVNIRAIANFAAKARFQNLQTNANINIIGTDENILIAESYKVIEGRGLTPFDIERGTNVAVIGAELKARLFPFTSPLEKTIFVDKNQYRVVGLLETKGTAFGSPGDKVCLIPITTMMKDYVNPERSFTINLYTPDPAQISILKEQATGVFRSIRQLAPAEDNNFVTVVADSFINNLMENLKILTLSATVIAMITLFGASIGLMNIMLVSVTERTMEIGLRKAVGATKKQILFQFLVEAVVICQAGGILGVLFGVGIGNGVSLYLKAGFIIPWDWIGLAFVICFVVGVVSGLYPAVKAAKLDPIETLRYE